MPEYVAATVRITPSPGQAVYVYPSDGGPSAEGTFVQAVVVFDRVMAVVDLDEAEMLSRSGLVVSRVLVDMSSLRLQNHNETIVVET